MHSTHGRGAWTSAALVFVTALALGGCASAPRPFSAPDRDGPEAHPPPDLASVPDAEPKLEPVRPGGPNKPYEVMGQDYVPITQDAPFTERGLASWYGRKFQGKRTSSGEPYNMYAMTAAHPTLPIPSYARIRNLANGREVVVRINDRGPFHSGRIVDLSYTAALKLDLLRGVATVELERITEGDIRTGAWRRDAGGEAVRVATATASAAPAAVVVPADSVVATSATSHLPVSSTPSTWLPAPPAPPAPSAPSAPPAAADPAAAAEPGAAESTPATRPPLSDAPAAQAFTAPARGFWIQLGAFRQQEGAVGFQRRVAAEADWLMPLLTVFSDAAMFRLQAGPYPSREEARSAAERVREALALVPVIVERR